MKFCNGGGDYKTRMMPLYQLVKKSDDLCIRYLPQRDGRTGRRTEMVFHYRALHAGGQEDPLAVHCFCVCSGSVLLGDLLGVNRSRERDLLSGVPVNSVHTAIPTPVIPTPAIPNPNPIVSIAGVGKAGAPLPKNTPSDRDELFFGK